MNRERAMDLPERQKIIMQKVKITTNSLFPTKSCFALLDTDAVLHLGTLRDIQMVEKDMKTIKSLDDAVSSLIEPQMSIIVPRIRQSFEIERNPGLLPKSTNSLLRRQRSQSMEVKLALGSSSVLNGSPSFLGSRYRVLHAFPAPGHRKRVCIIIDLSLSTTPIYFPNSSDSLLSNRRCQESRSSRPSYERSTQTFTDVIRSMSIIGNMKELMEPWNPVEGDEESAIFREHLRDVKSEGEFCKLVLRVESPQEVSHWVDAVQVACYFRKCKSSLVHNATTFRSAEEYEEKIYKLRQTNKWLESEVKKVKQEYESKIDEMNRQIVGMYPAEMLHDLVEEHEKQLQEERNKQQVLEKQLEDQKIMTVSLNSKIQQLHSHYEPAVGEFTTIKLRFEELQRKYVDTEKEYHILKAQLDKAQQLNKRLSSQVSQANHNVFPNTTIS